MFSEFEKNIISETPGARKVTFSCWVNSPYKEEEIEQLGAELLQAAKAFDDEIIDGTDETTVRRVHEIIDAKNVEMLDFLNAAEITTVLKMTEEDGGLTYEFGKEDGQA